MSNRSMTDIAFDILSEKTEAVPFAQLWAEVKATLNITNNNKISSFYESLMLDNRFTANSNHWDLASRYTFDETHVDLSEIEVGEEDEKDDEFSDGETGEEREIEENKEEEDY